MALGRGFYLLLRFRSRVLKETAVIREVERNEKKMQLPKIKIFSKDAVRTVLELGVKKQVRIQVLSHTMSVTLRKSQPQFYKRIGAK